MKDNSLNIISKNIIFDEKNMIDSIVKRRLHLQDLAKIIKEEIIKETNQSSITYSIFHFDIVKTIVDKYLSILKKEDEDSLDLNLLNQFNYNFDKLYVLSLLVCQETEKMNFNDTIKMVVESSLQLSKKDYSISYVRSALSNIATENFAKVIRGSQLKIKDTYNSIFDDLIEGKTDYAVIPVENSTDGRLGYFRSIIDKNELYTILTTEVEGENGENTKFDLVCPSLRILNYRNEILARFKITLNESIEVKDIQEITNYVSAKITKIFSLSPGETGRDNSFDFICDCSKANLPMLLCYLKLCYPQFIFGGFFSNC